MTFGQSKGRGGGSLVSVERAACCLLAFVLAGHGSSVRGTEFSWVPVDADGAFTVAGSDNAGEPTEIILDEGPATIVEFELRLNGWSLAAGSPTLGTAQAGVDATGFLGVNAVPSNPGVDLTPLNNQAWREGVGGFGQNDGAFMALSTCHDFGLVDSLLVCSSEPGTMIWNACPPASVLCLGRDDFVFNGNLAVKGVSTATPNFVWGGVSTEVCTTDVGASGYLGTLVLNVPGGAKGSYTFGFEAAIAQTFMNDCSGNALLDDGLAKTPGRITLRADTGKCCYNTRIDPQCIDSVTEFDCNAELAPRFFTLGATCSEPPDPDECAIDCNGVAVSNGGQVAGDATGDGFVTSADYSLIAFNICTLSGPDVPHTPGCDFLDFDCDGDFDLRDFSGFQHAFAP